jgi:ABC-type Fe3+-hydroxamate transport system substrate-binding protein
MDQLIIDTLVLDAARIDVSRIHSEFTEATDRSERLADAVGHAALAERVQEFVNNWDHRRAELAEQLATVRDNLAVIVEGFAATDQDLAAALTEQADTYPPRMSQVPV